MAGATTLGVTRAKPGNLPLSQVGQIETPLTFGDKPSETIGALINGLNQEHERTQDTKAMRGILRSDAETVGVDVQDAGQADGGSSGYYLQFQ